MRKVLFIQILLCLCGISIASAQAEHYVGLAVSNVTGPSYTLRHNRWSAAADAGWLTGFNGMYASVGGMYELLSMNKLLKFFKVENADHNDIDLLASMGLGFFAQDYCRPSARQRRWAENLSYVAPFGCNVLGEFRWRKETSDWSFALRLRSPVYFTAQEYSDIYSKGTVAAMLATAQLVVQYKF